LAVDTTINGYSVIVFGKENDQYSPKASFNIIVAENVAFSESICFISNMKMSLTEMYPGIQFQSENTFLIDGFEVAEIVYVTSINDQNLFIEFLHTLS